MSMAAKLNNLADKMSGDNLQTEGHVDVPPQGAKDLQELEALDSSHLPLTILVPSPETTIQLP